MVSVFVDTMSQAKRRSSKGSASNGKLRIGDMWNAITIIALSQNNPLKAIAEFVENSIDAKASHITVTRGVEHKQPYIRIKDDGEGIPRDDEGLPDFRYVATHICDSIKRELKAHGAQGIQGEFGIGLLSFWTVGEVLTLTCAGEDGHTYQMRMEKGDPGYSVSKRRFLFPEGGTELEVRPLLAGLRQLSGEKIQWYLASELRDRIRQSGVEVRVIDRTARKEFAVEPRRFAGRLLHDLPATSTPLGDVYAELYLTDEHPEHRVGLGRSGTRVLESVGQLSRFNCEPWTSGYLEGILDVPFLHLTPGTRDGVVHDDALQVLCDAVAPLESALNAAIQEQREAEEQRASKHLLRSVQRALREALLALPAEEYAWFDVRAGGGKAARSDHGSGAEAVGEEASEEGAADGTRVRDESGQRQFFEYEGPLFSVKVSPASSVVAVGTERGLRAVARDKSRRHVERDVTFEWRLVEGEGRLSSGEGECVQFLAPDQPCLARVAVVARQGETECRGEGLLTVTDSLERDMNPGPESRKGLPGYTFHRAPGELWRSRYDEEKNVIVINNGHRDFVFAARSRARKLRYISRLFSKELILRNFPGVPVQETLERMIELSLYTEENLR